MADRDEEKKDKGKDKDKAKGQKAIRAVQVGLTNPRTHSSTHQSCEGETKMMHPKPRGSGMPERCYAVASHPKVPLVRILADENCTMIG